MTKVWKNWDAVTLSLLGLLLLAFIFGGASRLHALRLAIVELGSLPLFVLAVSGLLRNRTLVREHKFAFGLLFALAATPLVQLIPLPPGVWTNLPGRGELVLALELVGDQPGWIGLSLTPEATWRAFLALLPPVAVFIGLMVSRHPQLALRCVQAILAFGTISILIGAVQLASGDQRFYAWETTGAGFIVGLFANRNHFATLMLVCLPFATVIATREIIRHPDRRALWSMLLATAYGVIGLAIAAAQSRAGILLFPPTLVLSLVLGWRALHLGRPRAIWLLGGGGVVVALLAGAVLLMPQLLERFESSQQVETRFQRWPIVAEAAQAYLPLGSGIGSFDPVFRTVEPLNQLDSTYFNHAHNEYLEAWVEAGWFGAALILAFLYWWGRRTYAAWFVSQSPDRSMRRAASIAILVILVHSTVDYPLRTVTIALIMAISAAILEGVSGQQLAAGRRVRQGSGIRQP